MKRNEKPVVDDFVPYKAFNAVYFVHMGFEEKIRPASNEALIVDFPKVSEGMVANMLQISLIPLAFKARHPEIEVDMSNPEIRHRAAAEWADKEAGIYPLDAELFRAYIKKNPNRTIDLSNEEEISGFLQDMWDSVTMH
jgi:hypothetical protein